RWNCRVYQSQQRATASRMESWRWWGQATARNWNRATSSMRGSKSRKEDRTRSSARPAGGEGKGVAMGLTSAEAAPSGAAVSRTQPPPHRAGADRSCRAPVGERAGWGWQGAVGPPAPSIIATHVDPLFSRGRGADRTTLGAHSAGDTTGQHLDQPAL